MIQNWSFKMEVHAALNRARIALQNSELKKSGQNKFAGYSYFELADFLPTVNKIFIDELLCGVVSYGTELATLTITSIVDNSSITITSPMAEANLKGCHPIQNLGAVETYTRRYLWVTALEIVEHDALDATSGKEDRKDALAKGKTPPPNESGKSITKSVWDELPLEQQVFLNDIAMDIVAAFDVNNLTECNRLFYENKLDNEEQIALWSRLDSKQRSAIKAYHDNLKETK
jgi:ERF superfamily